MTSIDISSRRPRPSRPPTPGPGVANYSVIKGHPLAGKVFPPRSPHNPPHYHVHLLAANAHFDIAINVHSSDGSQVLYRMDPAFHPLKEAQLAALAPGLHPIGGAGAGGLGLDFIRQHLVTREQMKLLDMGPAALADAPIEELIAEASATPLHNAIDTLIQSAIALAGSEVYAFGSAFHNAGANPFFGFSPDDGGHNIHMNQGNPTGGSFAKDNGIYKDGAIFVRFPRQPTWQALFIAFQTQSWHTDDSGRPI